MADGNLANTITVVSDIDGRRCKLVIKSGLETLTVANIKKHLVKPTGVEVGDQVLTYEGRALTDRLTGGQLGLKGGDQLRLSVAKRSSGVSGGSSVAGTLPGSGWQEETARPPLQRPPPEQTYARPSSHAAPSPPMPAYTPAMPPPAPPAAPPYTALHPAPHPALARDEYTAPTGLTASSQPPPVGPPVEPKPKEATHLPPVKQSDWQLEVRTAHLECENERLLRELERVKEEAAMAAAAAQEKHTDLEARLAATEQLATLKTASVDSLTERLHEAEHRLQASEEAAEAAAAAAVRGGPRRQGSSYELARENLRAFGKELGVGEELDFDASATCVVGVERRYTILLTFDEATERLYVYSTLLTYLPKDPVMRLRLYEMLMEGAFMGREMCGGGVGLSLKNEVVLMATSIDLKHCDGAALNSVAPAFVDCLVQWRESVQQLLHEAPQQGAQQGQGRPTPQPPASAVGVKMAGRPSAPPPSAADLTSTLNAQEQLIAEQQKLFQQQRQRGSL